MTEQLEFKELHLFTRSEAAKVLSISKEKLNKIINNGLIGVLSQNGRLMIPYKSLAEYIEKNTVVITKNSTSNSSPEISLIDIRKTKAKSDFDSRRFLKKLMEKNNG